MGRLIVRSAFVVLATVIQLVSSILSPLPQQRFVVKLPTSHEASQLASYLNVTLVGPVGQLDGYFVLEDPSPNSDHHNTINAIVNAAAGFRTSSSTGHNLRDAPVAIEPLHRRQTWFKRDPQLIKRSGLDSFNLNDPQVRSQWHLYNSATAGNDINIAPVWAKGITGQGITVCFIDDGLDYTHPDLRDNFYAAGSYDFNAAQLLPTPGSTDNHGTRCAGEVGASPNNSVCGVGVAYKSRISGVRILSDAITAADEAGAINYDYQHNDIYSCSWGPADDGKTVEGPADLFNAALLNGVRRGRNGLGSVYVFASGNGGAKGDNCNFDGYANSVYVMAIGAIDLNNERPYYAERCTAIMAVTYSSNTVTGITTTNINNGCYANHGGTSAAAPIASGIVALLLSVRSDLTWRDVQNIIRLSAIPFELTNADRAWSLLPNGLHYSDWHGYGKLDANSTISFATNNYTLLGPFGNVTIESGLGSKSPLSIPDASSITHQLIVTPQNMSMSLEKVTIRVFITHQRRGDLRIVLKSPINIESVLATPRINDASEEGLWDWSFTSLKHWSENVTGTWTITITDTVPNSQAGVLYDWQMTFWGANVTSSYDSLKTDSDSSNLSGTNKSTIYVVVGVALALVATIAAVFVVRAYRARRRAAVCDTYAQPPNTSQTKLVSGSLPYSASTTTSKA